jgi:hypothetical protein
MLNELPKDGKNRQIPLPFTEAEHNARETRKAAFKRPRSPQLRRIADLVRDSGHRGLIRDQIAEILERPVHGLSGSVLALLRDGELVETMERRPTRWRSPAVVLKHRDFAGTGVMP